MGFSIRRATPVVALVMLACVGLAGCKRPAGSGKPAPPLITVDGDLSDAAWADALKIDDPWTEVNANKPVDNSPVVLITYDAVNLYVAFRCAEPHMDKLVAEVKEHDAPVWTDDSVEMFLDPTGGHTEYYQVIVNTLGTVYDGRTRDAEWTSHAVAKVKKSANAWTVEVAIPLARLGVKTPPAGQTWTGNFCRNRLVTGETEAQAWANTGRDFHTPEAFKPFTLK